MGYLFTVEITGDLGSDLQDILQQSYDYLTIMPKLRSTYDGRLIYETSCKERKAFLATIYLQNRKIVRDSVRELAHDIPERNFSKHAVSHYRKSMLR